MVPVVVRGRAGGDPGLAYLEWGAQRGCAAESCTHAVGAAGCALDDEARWAAANPSLGRRIPVEHVRKERRALTPAEFSRERLGWWEDPATSGADVDLSAWGRCEDPDAAPGDPVALAVDVSPGFRSAAIVACGSGPDGRPVLEVVEHAAGSAWLPDRLAALVATHNLSGPVGVDPSGPAGALLPQLAAAGVRIDPMPAARVTQACGGIVAAVLAEEVVHRGDQALTAAVEAGKRRTHGDASRWSRRDSEADISPLVAATLARQLWAERGDPEPGMWVL